MTVYGKRITKKQAEILEELFSYFDAIHRIADEYGEDEVDMTDTSQIIVEEAQNLYIAFRKTKKKLSL